MGADSFFYYHGSFNYIGRFYVLGSGLGDSKNAQRIIKGGICIKA